MIGTEIRVVCLILSLAFAAGKNVEAGQVMLLDLTTPGDSSNYPSGYGITVSAAGGFSDGRIVNPRYEIPLEITIANISRSDVAIDDPFLLEIDVKNIGSETVPFPVSRDFGRLLVNGNRGRRTAYLRVELEDTEGIVRYSASVAALIGSSSAPTSILSLRPGDSLRVRASIRLTRQLGATQIPEDDGNAMALRALYSEQTLKDDEYRVKVRSETISSTNSARLNVRPRRQ